MAKLATGVTGNTARRAIVTNAKCSDCHAGQRNDAPTCTFCHNVNRVNSGWGVNTPAAAAPSGPTSTLGKPQPATSNGT